MICNNKDRIFSASGDPIKQLYVPELTSSGLKLVDGGQLDLDQVIQDSSSYCDLALLLQRYEAGDVEALTRKQGLFGDATLFPRDSRSMIENLRSARQFYDSLGSDSGFTDFNDFLSKVNDSDFMSNIKDINFIEPNSDPDPDGGAAE